MSNLSKVIYEADGSASTFSVPFTYISKDHVHLFVNGKEMPFHWLNENTVGTYNFIPKAGDIVEVRRITPLDTKLVNFHPSAVLTDEELNIATKQNFFLLQEFEENFNGTIGDILNREGWGGGGGTASEIIDRVVQNVLESELLAELQQSLTDIDDNGNSIVENILLTEGLSTTVSQVQGDIAGINTRIDGLSDIYVDGTSLQSELDALHDQIVNEVSGGSVALENYYTKEEADQNLAGMQSTIATQREQYVSGILVDYYSKTETDSAIASAKTAILSQAGADRASALESYYTKVQVDASIAASQVTLRSERDDAIAQTISNYYTKAEADSAISQEINSLETRVDDNLAVTLQNYYTKADTDSAIAQERARIISEVDTTRASILTDYYTKSQADSAISTATTTISSDVDDLSSAVQTQAQAINGLEAQYTVKVDSNGHVAGFGLATTSNNGVPTSEFIVNADKFAIVSGNNSPVVPFAADANGVYMPNAFIRDLEVEKINGGDVLNEWNLGSTGRIVMDTGSHVRVVDDTCTE